MTSEPDYSLRRDRSHACAVPWSDAGTDAHWRCAECGRWWERNWELAGDQPPVDYDRLAHRAGIPRDEIELKLVAVVDEVRLKYPIDDKAILLTGASMGGFGTWDLATRCHGRFSAVAPVSGGGDPLRAESLARLPFCVIHGAQDTVVPVERSLEMVRAIRGHGNAGHPAQSLQNGLRQFVRGQDLGLGKRIVLRGA